MTMGRMILTGSLNMMPLNIAKTALTPISAAFAYWMRCSEFSADRAAILCDGTPDKTFEVCMRLSGMDKDIIHRANIFAFFNQAKEYKEYIEKNPVNRLREFYQFYQTDHPVLSVRALEAKEWAESENFIKSKQFFAAYKKDEAPKELPIAWTEKHFIGRDFEEVEQELLDFGFYDIEMIRSQEKTLRSKERAVTNVDIKGTDKYKEGDWYSADSIVEVTYYLPFTEEEIEAMHVGEIKITEAPKHFIGMPYQETEMELLDLGFNNIEIDEKRRLNNNHCM